MPASVDLKGTASLPPAFLSPARVPESCQNKVFTSRRCQKLLAPSCMGVPQLPQPTGS
jgi:hypothetical protein